MKCICSVISFAKMQSVSWQSLHTNQQRLFTYCCQLPPVQQWNRYVQHYARVQIWTKFPFTNKKNTLYSCPWFNDETNMIMAKKMLWAEEMLSQLKSLNALCTRSFAMFPALQRLPISSVTVFASNHWNSMLADR